MAELDGTKASTKDETGLGAGLPSGISKEYVVEQALHLFKCYTTHILELLYSKLGIGKADLLLEEALDEARMKVIGKRPIPLRDPLANLEQEKKRLVQELKERKVDLLRVENQGSRIDLGQEAR